jgi:hypothetical protein
MLGIAILPLSPQMAHAQTKVVFAYTGTLNTFVVPSGVTSLTVKLWGGGGGSAGGYSDPGKSVLPAFW